MNVLWQLKVPLAVLDVSIETAAGSLKLKRLGALVVHAEMADIIIEIFFLHLDLIITLF